MKGAKARIMAYDWFVELYAILKFLTISAMPAIHVLPVRDLFQ